MLLAEQAYLRAWPGSSIRLTRALGYLGRKEVRMSDDPEDTGDLHSERIYLQRIARDMRTMCNLMGKFVFMMERAESEVPENVRRFTGYMHDIHDITYMYEERGLPVPRHQLNEMERCDDRYRQILKAQHEVGGAFEKIRTEMAPDQENRWDHTRQLTFKGEKRKDNSHGKSPVAEGNQRPPGAKGRAGF